MRFIVRHWGFFSVAVLLLSAGWIAWTAVSSPRPTGGRAPAPRAGFLAPDFELATGQGETTRLSDLIGKVVVVNIWASWCPPCKAEMPDLQRLHEEYGPRGLVILAVNATNQDSLAAMQAFVDQNGLTFPVLLDTDGTVSRKYQVQALPTTFFIDRAGIVRQVTVGGPIPAAFLWAQAESLLKEMP